MRKTTIILSLMLSHLGFSQVTDTGDKVGIGTTSPSAKLEVKRLGNTLGGKWIPNNSYLTLDSGNGSMLLLDPNEIYGSSALHFGSKSGDIAVFRTVSETSNASDKMIIKNNGNVGIGTMAPYEKLQVNGLIRIGSATNVDNDSPGIVLASNDDFLYDGQYINHYAFGFHGYQDGSTTFAEPQNTYMSGYFGVDFFTLGQNRMRISHDGIVSIGTVNRQPGYKLAVNGNIKAKEIKVETGWSDFVFENNYKLPTLKEVEQHIKEKGHLKDIPSAEEVAKNGVFLGEMDAKLLQKIEELTLYTIAQEKRMNKLEEENETLKVINSKLLELQGRLEKLESGK
ncbi:hypothetical protein [Flavivirga sp. 57AJ16]|uniref:hypothetical protein n=1 Tax=Flavivirga sp. 57AJ16 TaxID=3025307 RepID=UPI0023660A4C|nr:hypothetical protein [Flavivirga sp. 57AJ16]MDD7886047.1 hypothetical protein [Flavivirga sp. 57AJ16]